MTPDTFTDEIVLATKRALEKGESQVACIGTLVSVACNIALDKKMSQKAFLHATKYLYSVCASKRASKPQEGVPYDS